VILHEQNTRHLRTRARSYMRVVVFTLASLSFACLLGQFYGFWTMRFFGCWVVPPATAMLCFIAWRHRFDPRDCEVNIRGLFEARSEG